MAVRLSLALQAAEHPPIHVDTSAIHFFREISDEVNCDSRGFFFSHKILILALLDLSLRRSVHVARVPAQ